ncbi:hypothetical protein P43SY_004315 [Pythium insidiosum]|uniref:Uncharacterized protein n=1 Tax=Pythium insidiosum TaxID=114742 RepID=A0AAD5Q5H4_PYTIN|nr:hypothetical protein P43SY_004315 [Pythium insidiosum]
MLKGSDASGLAAFVNENVARWLRLIFPMHHNAKVLFVATNDQDVDVHAVQSDLSSRLQGMVDGLVAVVKFRAGKKSFDKGNVHQAISNALASPVVLKASTFKTELPQAIVDSGVGIEMDERIPNTELPQAIVDSGVGIEMDERIPNVLEVIHQKRDESEQLINTARVEALVLPMAAVHRYISRAVKGITNSEGMKILRMLYEIGDVLLFEEERDNSLRDTVIIAPQLVTELMQQLAACGTVEDAQDDRGRGFVKSGLLTGKPVWQDTPEDVVFGLKCLMAKLKLVAPVSTYMSADTNIADTNMFVPAFWTARFKDDKPAVAWSNDSAKKDDDIDVKVPFLAEEILQGVVLKCAKMKKMTVNGLSPTCYELSGSARVSIVAGGDAIRVEEIEGKTADVAAIRGYVTTITKDV